MFLTNLVRKLFDALSDCADLVGHFVEALEVAQLDMPSLSLLRLVQLVALVHAYDLRVQADLDAYIMQQLEPFGVYFGVRQVKQALVKELDAELGVSGFVVEKLLHRVVRGDGVVVGFQRAH